MKIGDEEGDDEYIGSTYIDRPEIVHSEQTEPPIEEVPPSAIQPSPYTQRTFDDPDFLQYVRQVRSQGHLGSFPVVRPIEDGYEVVSGHKRSEAAKQAGLQSIPVFVTEMSDWEAAVWFVDEHIPITEDEMHDGFKAQHRGWYREEAVEGALDELVDRWGEEKAREHPVVRRWLDGEVISDDEEEEENEDDAPNSDEAEVVPDNEDDENEDGTPDNDDTELAQEEDAVEA
ncbi:ParB/RepB/Spo0J family partition protein [Halopelagius longus]|uniref:ParB-like nuclease domain-containing protein n=1 Tax=Halopelagius longus TaxID=1236180 RepID=A0A1H0XPI3_9EURY|nr:ParB N-terminal domain-containing protein [Halopelagius longus]SDQ04576.1 ParB-like nuclease domain-containing protein [Halopelagius longus]